MAKHHAISERSLKGRTVIAGVLASGALMVAAPAAIALADTGTNTAFVTAAAKARAPARPDAARDAAIGAFLVRSGVLSSPVVQRIEGDLSQTPQGQRVLAEFANRFGLGMNRKLAAN